METRGGGTGPEPGPQLGTDRAYECCPAPPSQAVPGSVPACTQPPRSLHKELVMWISEGMLIWPPSSYPSLVSSGGGWA